MRTVILTTDVPIENGVIEVKVSPEGATLTWLGGELARVPLHLLDCGVNIPKLGSEFCVAGYQAVVVGVDRSSMDAFMMRRCENPLERLLNLLIT